MAGGETVGMQDPAETRRLAQQPGRGRDAERVGELPAKGWRDVAGRVVKEVKADNLPLLSAGVAFYGLLSLFPALVAIVSIYGLAADPAQVADQLETLTRTMPADAAELLKKQVRTVTDSSGRALGVSALVGITTALWSASSGMKWLLTALSQVYDEPEDRKFVKLRGTALAMTVGASVGLVVSLGLIAATPALARLVGLGSTGSIVATVLRWPLLAALVVGGLAVVYKYGPNRDPAKLRWVSWGAAIGAVIWLAASAGFAAYSALAPGFAASYGSVAGVVVMMLWLFLTVFSVLLGAEINAELEHQTGRDTTTGQDRPFGGRGATMADEVGETARSHGKGAEHEDGPTNDEEHA